MTAEERDQVRTQIAFGVFLAAVWLGSRIVRAGLAMADAVTRGRM